MFFNFLKVNAKMKNRGFSLVEMMIVIAIIGIVAAIAAPSFNKYRDNINLKEAARELSSEIALCKQRAVTENVHYKITFDTGENSYTAFRGGQLASDPFVISETKNLGNISNQITICNITFTGAPPQIILQPRGTSSSLGSVKLRHAAIEKNAKISITNITGKINVSYDNNACP